MDGKLERLSAEAEAVDACSTTKGQELEALADEIGGLDAFASQSYYFLPSFDARSCTEATRSLRDRLASVRARLFPPKKFRFSCRPSGPTTVSADVESHAPRNEGRATSTAEGVPSSPVRGPGIYSRQGQQIVCSADDVASSSDFTLSQLVDCTVYLLGTCSTLHVSHVLRCRIHCVPVSSSILVDEARGCTFTMAGRQCRIHRTHDCDLYLCTCSHPVVEHCTSVRFGPYNFELDGVDAQLKEHGLDRRSSHWQAVQDFDWVRATPSPHWCVIPPEERTRAHPPPPGDVRTCGGEDGAHV